MKKLIGIRREDKNIWERRVPIIPEHVKYLKENFGIETILQPFERRAFSDDEYINAGAKINEDIEECPLILAVKEIPIKLLQKGKKYIYFSHTIKGQDYNMPMLQRLIDLDATLVDYECITDDNGRRVVFFGHFAGLAGMIDTLHGMGKRFESMGITTPFLRVKSAYEYTDIDLAKKVIEEVADEITKKGLPKEISPLVVGFAGYGNVSKGAQKIFDLLPHTVLTASELLSLDNDFENKMYKVVFKEKDMVQPKDKSQGFLLQDYYSHPEKYESIFYKYLNRLTVLVNAIYWDERYPRYITKEYVKKYFNRLKLQVIGDITCDIGGAIEFTYKSTESDKPAYTYNPKLDSFTDGYEGEGILDIAVDNLPTEIPRDSSISFSESLYKFMPGVLNADFGLPFDEIDLPPEIKRAVIVYNGRLTPDYKHLQKYLDQIK